MIRLGFCLDLAEAEHVEFMKDAYESYKDRMVSTGNPLPTNNRQYRKLDHDVFEYAYKTIDDSEPNLKVDTARGIYVPKDGSKRIWEGSWISRDTHIQLCVRNPKSLLGAWLHEPTSLGVEDVCKALQITDIDFDRKNPEGEAAPPRDVARRTD